MSERSYIRKLLTQDYIMKLYNVIFRFGIRSKEIFKLYFAKIRYPIICDKIVYYNNNLS